MKVRNGIIFIFLLAISIEAYNQNWKLISENERFNYSLNDETFNTTVWIDSAAVINGDSIFYLNLRMKYLGSEAVFPYADRYLDNQPTFLFQSHLYDSLGNITLVSEHDTLFFQLNMPLDTNWLFRTTTSDSIKIIAFEQQSIFGTLDSVQVMLTSKGDSIIFSKNHGILQFPLFDSSGAYYRLSGIEGRDSGQLAPQAPEIFNFSIGDEFHYKVIYESRWIDTTTYKKHIVLSKTSSSNQVSYKVDYYEKKIYSDILHGFYDTIYVHDTARILTYDYEEYLNKYNLERLKKDSATNNGSDYKPFKIGFDTTFLCVEKFFPSRAHCLINDTIIEVYDASSCGIDPYISKKYGNGFGLLELCRSSRFGHPIPPYRQEKLIGGVKNGIKYGELIDSTVFIPRLVVSVQEHQNNKPNFRIYPNPATSDIYLETEGSIGIYSISIIDQMGREVQTNASRRDFTYKVSIEPLSQGYYFLMIIDEEKNIHYHQFIKK